MQYKFLIYISYSYSIPIGRPLEKEITRLGHTVRWFADEDEGKEKLLSNPNALHNINEAVAYQPHIVLTATDRVAHFLSGIKVQIFHGYAAEKKDHWVIRISPRSISLTIIKLINISTINKPKHLVSSSQRFFL